MLTSKDNITDLKCALYSLFFDSLQSHLNTFMTIYIISVLAYVANLLQLLRFMMTNNDNTPSFPGLILFLKVLLYSSRMQSIRKSKAYIYSFLWLFFSMGQLEKISENIYVHFNTFRSHKNYKMHNCRACKSIGNNRELHS